MEYYTLPPDRTFLVTQKIVIADGSKILILKNAKSEFVDRPQWELPGGLVEIDENLEDGIKRETLEETGLEVKVLNPFTTWSFDRPGFEFEDGRKFNARIIGVAYLGERVSGEVKLSDEHEEYKWVSREELQNFEFASNSSAVVRDYLKKF